MGDSADQKAIEAIISNNTSLLIECDLKSLAGSKFSLDSNQLSPFFSGPYFNPYIPFVNLRLLDIAAIYDSIECFVYLQKVANHNIGEMNQNGYLPLHYACYTGASEVALYILSVDPDQAQTQPTSADQEDLIVCATLGSKIEILKELFKKGASLKSFTNKRQNNILQKAVSLFQTDIVLFLFKYIRNTESAVKVESLSLESCVESIFAYNNNAFSTFYQGKIDAVPCSTSAPNFLGLIKSICHFDNEKFFKETLKYILKEVHGFKIDPADSNGEGVVHWACQYADFEIAKLMLETPLYNINRVDNYQKPGICRLIDQDSPDVIPILELVISKGFDVKRYNENTPSLLEYFILCIQPNIEAIKILIANGADPNAKFSKGNCTIKEFAINQKCNDVRAFFSLL